VILQPIFGVDLINAGAAVDPVLVLVTADVVIGWAAVQSVFALLDRKSVV